MPPVARGRAESAEGLGGGRAYTGRVKIRKPVHAQVRKPMPRKPPKVEVPKTVYRRRPKHTPLTEGE